MGFSDPPTQCPARLLRGLRGEVRTSGESPGDVGYPFTIHHNGRVGGLYVLCAESAAARAEWKAKFEEAIGLRQVVQESNKIFEPEVLSSETFLAPSLSLGPAAPARNEYITVMVTCSIPFGTSCRRFALGLLRLII
jgi:hypothetical protein